MGVMEFLLGKGVWPDAFDARDEAALHLAARYSALKPGFEGILAMVVLNSNHLLAASL